MDVDRAGLVLAHGLRSPTLDVFFGGISWLGSQTVLLPTAAVVAALFWRRGWRPEARFLLLACFGSPLIGQLLKLVVERPRPDLYPALASVLSPLSFPSVHAMQVTAAALAAWFLLRHRAPRYAGCAIAPLLALVVMVVISRIYLQVHYPSDVMAGALLAAGWTWWMRQITI